MSTNHKDIGVLYIFIGVITGTVALASSIIMRTELSQVGVLLGDSQLYNVLVTYHGILMVFFMVMPLGIGRLGN